MKTPRSEPSEVRAQYPQAADKNRHLGSGQRQELRPIDQQFLSRSAVFAAHVVAEPVHLGFEHGEGVDIGLFL